MVTAVSEPPPFSSEDVMTEAGRAIFAGHLAVSRGWVCASTGTRRKKKLLD